MIRRSPLFRALTLAILSFACAAHHEAPPARVAAAMVAPPATPSIASAEFAGLIDRLSEPGGFFPSDNLVSNETSYLHVLRKMKETGVAGGAYVGVGPDQNFSYIAAVRPEIVFIIDIRRDNMLQHFLFKALFENARNRLEYLCLFLGKRTPPDLASWDTADVTRIIAYVDSTQSDQKSFDEAAARVTASATRFGYTLSAEDLATIHTIHTTFAEWGLDTRYSNRGRFNSFPSWRQLILETDLEGKRRNYLASEASFQFIKDLETRNLVVPVVGDLSGPHALAAIGQEVARRGLHISAFYTSNVEQYLFQQSGFQTFAATVSALPFDDRSVIIRSYFRGFHPQNVPGYSSTQLLEHFTDFAREFHNGGYKSYLELVTLNVLSLRS